MTSSGHGNNPIRFEGVLLNVEPAGSKLGELGTTEEDAEGEEVGRSGDGGSGGKGLRFENVDGALVCHFDNFSGVIKVTKSISSGIRRFSGGYGGTSIAPTESNSNSSALNSTATATATSTTMSSVVPDWFLQSPPTCATDPDDQGVGSKRTSNFSNKNGNSSKKSVVSKLSSSQSAHTLLPQFAINEGDTNLSNSSSISSAIINEELLRLFLDAETGKRTLARYGHIMVATATNTLLIHGGYGGNEQLQGDVILINFESRTLFSREADTHSNYRDPWPITVIPHKDLQNIVPSASRSLCESQVRAWHSAHYLQAANLVVCYGGEARKQRLFVDGIGSYRLILGQALIDESSSSRCSNSSSNSSSGKGSGGKSSKSVSGGDESTARVINHVEDKDDVYFDDVIVFDNSVKIWYPQSVSGKYPTARSGHSSTIFLNNLIVIYGGGKYNKFVHNIHVLDTNRWHWNSPKADGKPPKQRGYHSMDAFTNKDCVIFGGTDSMQAFNDVHVLTCNDKGAGWVWSQPSISPHSRRVEILSNGKIETFRLEGTCTSINMAAYPAPRAGHASCIIGNGSHLLIRGGWTIVDDERDKSYYGGGDGSFSAEIIGQSASSSASGGGNMSSNLDSSHDIRREAVNLGNFKQLNDMFALNLSTWTWTRIDIDLADPMGSHQFFFNINQLLPEESSTSGGGHGEEEEEKEGGKMGGRAVLLDIDSEKFVVFLGGIGGSKGKGLASSRSGDCFGIKESLLLAALA